MDSALPPPPSTTDLFGADSDSDDSDDDVGGLFGSQNKDNTTTEASTLLSTTATTTAALDNGVYTENSMDQPAPTPSDHDDLTMVAAPSLALSVGADHSVHVTKLPNILGLNHQRECRVCEALVISLVIC